MRGAKGGAKIAPGGASLQKGVHFLNDSKSASSEEETLVATQQKLEVIAGS